MFQGSLISIYISSDRGVLPHAVEEAKLVAGRGIEGDRYYLGRGTFSHNFSPAHELTLIEAEAIAAVARDSGIVLPATEFRRNLVTRGVPLNHLVGCDFLIGEAAIRGLRLCEPCSHLESLTTLDMSRALLHRGGLRAQILRGAIVRVGMTILPIIGPSHEPG